MLIMSNFWYKIVKIELIFDKKVTLIIKILLYLTFNTKSSQMPRTFLWLFS